jgi:hypothetical protein
MDTNNKSIKYFGSVYTDGLSAKSIITSVISITSGSYGLAYITTGNITSSGNFIDGSIANVPNSGALFILNNTSGSGVYLPTPILGVNYTFIVGVIANHVINVPSPCMYGTLNNQSANGTMSLSIETTSGNSAIGDRIEFISDGIRYYVSGSVYDSNTIYFS